MAVQGREEGQPRSLLPSEKQKKQVFPSAFHTESSRKTQENPGVSCRGQASLTVQLPASHKWPF